MNKNDQDANRESAPLTPREESVLKELQAAYQSMEKIRGDVQFRKTKHIIEQKIILRGGDTAPTQNTKAEA